MADLSWNVLWWEYHLRYFQPHRGGDCHCSQECSNLDSIKPFVLQQLIRRRSIPWIQFHYPTEKFTSLLGEHSVLRPSKWLPLCTAHTFDITLQLHCHGRPFLICDLRKFVRKWPKKVHLLNQDVHRIFFVLQVDVLGLEDVPPLSPN